MPISDDHRKLLMRTKELKYICNRRSPWSFVCAAVLLDHLARLVGPDNPDGYKSFIDKWLSKVRPTYKNFAYSRPKKPRSTVKSPHSDLAVQMYHVMRCGMVHGLSLTPDTRGKNTGGWRGSIALCHKNDPDTKKGSHLSHYPMKDGSDAALFVAEDFVNDIEKVINIIFEQAKKDAKLKSKMSAWLKNNPLVTGD